MHERLEPSTYRQMNQSQSRTERDEGKATQGMIKTSGMLKDRRQYESLGGLRGPTPEVLSASCGKRLRKVAR